MFKKLLSNLPFNPSLITQVSFYAKRLHKEAVLRRAGLIMVSLAMAVQLFAVISPAEASNQCSSNDVVRCGFSTRDEAVQKCNSNAYGYGSILSYYGITCAMVANASTQSVKSTANGNTLYSMGRNPYSKPGEYAVDIPNAGHFYLRPLSSWDSAGASTYRMLTLKTPDGQPFMLMYDCGNIVIKKGYSPPAKKEPAAALRLAKANNPTGPVKPGDTISYTLAFTNTGGTAAFFSVNDRLDPHLEYVDSTYNGWILKRNGQETSWMNNTPYNTFGNTDAFGTPGFITIRARVKADTPSGTSVCNVGWLGDVNTTTKAIQTGAPVTVCNPVVIDCPSGTIANNGKCEPVKVPDAACSYLKITKESSRTKYVFESKSTTVNGATVSAYRYDFGDGTNTTQSNSKGTSSIEHDFKKDGTYTVKVTVVSSVGAKAALTCETQVTIKPDEGAPLLSIQKKAKNITQSKDDANGTTAAAGDVIEYSLTTTNYGQADAKDTVLRPEALADVLEYADLDLSTLNGAVFDKDASTLNWDKPVTIKPTESVTKTFKVKVKTTIPQTPSPAGNPGSFDLVMTNVYGNTVQIKLPTTIAKSTEQITQELPNTGPGEALGIGFVLTLVVGYFFARSRLMAKELDLVKQEYTSGN